MKYSKGSTKIWRQKKDALDVQVIIMEGEKKDFEARISELESRDFAVSQQVGELKTQVE